MTLKYRSKYNKIPNATHQAKVNEYIFKLRLNKHTQFFNSVFFEGQKKDFLQIQLMLFKFKKYNKKLIKVQKKLGSRESVAPKYMHQNTPKYTKIYA